MQTQGDGIGDLRVALRKRRIERGGIVGIIGDDPQVSDRILELLAVMGLRPFRLASRDEVCLLRS